MELADFSSIVHMFTDAGAAVIVADVHYTNSFDPVRKTGEIEVPIGLLKRNHFFGYSQVCGNRLVNRCFYFFCFIIGQGSIEVVVTFGLLLVHVGAEATSTVEFPDH